MSTHANRVQMTVTSVASAGVGTITLNAASSGYRTFASAYGADATVDILITEGTTWEIARSCTYTNSGTTVTRGTLESSSTGSAVVFTSAAVVSVVATAAFGNSVDNLLGAWGALNGENSITGAATAVIGRLNVCSGTTSSYTVTLPAVSGNTGKYIGFVMVAGLTKLVTLDGNASETIDGATTRVMWASESALLYCNGTTWTKMAGKSLPMYCTMYKAANEELAASNVTKKNAVDTVLKDNTGLMANTGSSRIDVLRTSIYAPDSSFWVDPGGISGIARQQCYMYIDGSITGAPAADLGAYLSSGYVISPIAFTAISLTVGAYVELWGSLQYSGGTPNFNCGNSGTRTHLGLIEIPSW